MELLAAYDKDQQKMAVAAGTETVCQDWTIAAQGSLPEAGSAAANPQQEGGSNSTTEISSSDGAPAVGASYNPEQAASRLIDLSSKVEVAPVVIPPGMPLTFIYHIMQEQGLNYVPVIRHHGPLEGMVTRWAPTHNPALRAAAHHSVLQHSYPLSHMLHEGNSAACMQWCLLVELP
jgi:hypothetical protein